jgi:hypothetical protein
MTNSPEFDSVHAEMDPIRRARRAGELIAVYQQRATELARLRREAIEEAHRQGVSYTDIAVELGLTKGRITQIRTGAPPVERAFFGVGPVAVGIPARAGFADGRERGYFDTADIAARSAVVATLAALSLAVTEFAILPSEDLVPPGDCVIICGPKSAPVAGRLLDEDSALGFEHDESGWWIVDHVAGERYGRPTAGEHSSRSEFGYFARHVTDNRVVVHIAGITSVGSLGVAHHLSNGLPGLFQQIGNRVTSGVIECVVGRGPDIAESRLVAGPYSEIPG